MKQYKEILEEGKKKKPKKDEYVAFQVAQGDRKIKPKKKLKEARDILSPEQTELHKSLAKHYKFSTDHKAMIGTYTADSAPLNNHLWRAHQEGVAPDIDKHHGWGAGDFQPHEARSVRNMDAVVHAHKTPQAMIVHTGLRQSPEHDIKDQPGHEGKMVHPAYLSTSTELHQASEFAHTDRDSIHGPKPTHNDKDRTWRSDPTGYGHIMSIHVPKGHPGAYVAHHSAHDYEREFVLPRNTKLNVNKTPNVDHKNKLVRWNAHVEPHEM